MHIHIASCGYDSGGVLNCIRKIPEINKIYFLYSKTPDGKIENTANDLFTKCTEIGYKCEKKLIDSYDFQSVVDTIYNTYDAEYTKGVQFSINITRGTNIVAAAACSTALFIGSKIYYMKGGPNMNSDSEELIEIPAPKVPDIKNMKGKTKEFLKFILERTNNGEEFISRGIFEKEFDSSPSLTGYHLGQLEKSGLIVIQEDPKSKRNKVIKLTREGRMVAGWLT